MDVSANTPVLTAKDVPNDISWVPTTPAKLNLTNPKPACVDSQENEAVRGNWFESQIVSQGNQKRDESNLEMERLPLRFSEETQIQNIAEGFELANSIDLNRNTIDINDISRDFDTWEAAVAAKAQVTGGKAVVYDNLSMDDANKWTNVSFGNLLALAHAAAADTVCNVTTNTLNAVEESLAHAAAGDTCCDATSTIKSVTESLTEESYFQNLPANSSLSDKDLLHGTECWTGCDQVSGISSHGSSMPCKPSFDLNSPPKESIESQFAPITPNQSTGAYTEQVFNVPGTSFPEPRNVQERGLAVRDVLSNELLQQNDQSQLVVDQSSAGISTELQEIYAPDQDSELHRTPQQKPRRKKHRPKVVIEGQPKRTYKPRTPKPPTPEGTVPGKRKYVRRNGGSNVMATSQVIETDGIASTMGFPSSQEMPVAKRTYVPRKGVDNLGAMSLEDRISRNDDMIGQQTRSSCRRSLNFDSESHAINGNYGLSSNFDSGTRAVGIAYDLNCAMYQVSEGYASISQRQPCGPSTPPKNHQPTEGHQNECTRGKCQIVFSDATHDKEVNFVQMMMKSPSSPNSSSSACLTQETQARGSKRQHSSTEAEFCSINVIGAHYNSLQSYLRIFFPNEGNSNGFPSMHFPEIHKRRRTEKGHKSATCGSESTVTDAENGSTNKSSAFNKAHRSLLTGMSTHGILATQCDSSADPTRYALVSYNAQQKQNFHCLQALGDNQRMTKRRSKGPTRARASLRKSRDQLSTANGKPTKVRGEVVDQPHGCMVGTAQNHAPVTTKKRSKRNSSAAPPLAITWKSMSPVDEIIEHFHHLDISTQNSRLGYHEQNALISYQKDYPEQNALVVYQRDGTIVPFNDSFIPSRKRKPRPKVDLDDETGRVWKLLLEDINSEGIDGTDEEKAKWWEEERRVFRGRADSFIARMHLVQGDRRFSPWKGSVLDSVIGVFLTQNVSDHLSSSAFMSLAAQYPLKSNSKHEESHEEQISITANEPEFHVLDPDDVIAWHEKSNQSTCGQGSITQQYMEQNGELAANSNEALRSSSCGVKSTGNSTGDLTDSSKNNSNVCHDPPVNRISQPLRSSVGDQTELDDILSCQNSADSLVAQTENSESCSLRALEGQTTEEAKTKHFSGSTSFVELLQMAGTTKFHGVCNQANRNGSYGGSSQLQRDECNSEKTYWPGDAEAFPRAISPSSISGSQEIQNSGAQGSRCSDQELCATENSGFSAESANQTTLERTRIVTLEEVLKSTSENENSTNNHQIEVNLNIIGGPEIIDESQIQQQEDNYKMHHALDSPNLSLSTSEVIEQTIITENPSDHRGKSTQSSLKACYDNTDSLIDAENASTSKGNRGKSGKKKQKVVDWDNLRKEAQTNGKKRERTADTMDSLDWEAVRRADVKEIADTIKARGMNNMLAERIKALLDRLVKEHGSIELEWLRDVPPDQAKEYLLSIRGLGLKSVECVRLLTLHHLAFPVDTNVGRIAVRLGWVPLQPLPESLQLHLLELYPVLESIQKYLWPRLCKLDQRTLYELHYQMITFGKVFCTKNKPNCNACPMRGECRHFASAFASARLALPAPEDKTIAIVTKNQTANQNPVGNCSSSKLCLPQADELSSVGICSSSNLCLQCIPSSSCVPQAIEHLRAHSESSSSNPIVVVPSTPEPTVEEPHTPEPEQTQVLEADIEEFEDPDEIPTIKLNMEEFTQNLQMFVGKNMELQKHEMSKALVALTAEAASIPTPKLKNVNRLRTEHHVYELPDSHPLLQGLDERERDDPCPYLLAIWTPGETANSVQPPENTFCNFNESGTLCDEETCFSCNSAREANSQTVRGTLLIPCRTAMRGSFPLNGTYFQVNEVFADHESSLNPIDVPRSWIWNLPRRTVYFGTSVPSIFKGLCTEEIQYCFWRGFVCVRGFEQKTRVPRPLMARLHFPASKLTKTKGRMDGED